MNRSFEGRTFLVTGGGGDIGSAAAKYFAERGARIAVADLRKDAVGRVVEELKASGADAAGFICNVTSAEDVDRMVAEVLQRMKTIDFLFNNAGYQGNFAPIQDSDLDDFRKVIEINLTGAYIVLKAVASPMIKNGFGRIVNMASRAGTVGAPNMAAYAASKAGLIGMTRTAAKDLAPHGILVNSIGPALLGPGMMWDRQVALQAGAGSQYFSEDPEEVAAQMIKGVPLRRLGSLEEVASVVGFLMSDESSYLTGVHIPIGGGLL
jgi:NAD(P)-dependent dehydrogenase (short-subunit alcohol dehydrogenase family)